MTSIVAGELQNWQISYNPYIDLFQVFSEVAFHTPDTQISKDNIGDATLLYLTSGHKLILIEFRNAYSHVGDIDNMSKSDIIQSVIGYLHDYGK